nr:MAG TPA_asm: hypothetical protein [Bacteriophage sp.]
MWLLQRLYLYVCPWLCNRGFFILLIKEPKCK